MRDSPRLFSGVESSGVAGRPAVRLLWRFPPMQGCPHLAPRKLPPPILLPARPPRQPCDLAMNVRTLVRLLLCLSLFLVTVAADATDPAPLPLAGPASAALLDLFPPSTATRPPPHQGTTTLSTAYQPNGSVWDKHLDEQTVFLAELTHRQTTATDFSLRIGQGGQLYSLRAAFGESVPPQSASNPWNDEVWQFVAVCPPYNNTPKAIADQANQAGYAATFFVHNSGAYRQAFLDSGTITIAFDVMLDPEHPGDTSLLLRAPHRANTPWQTLGSLRLRESGVTFEGQPIGGLTPGIWHHVELVFGPTSTTPTAVQVRVQPRDGIVQAATVSIPPAAGLGWMAFMALADEDCTTYLDNLRVTRSTPAGTETPLDVDCETYPPLTVIGEDPDKQATISVTDAVAASGRRCLAIRDATGLSSTNMPRLLFPAITSVAGDAFYCPLLATDMPGDGRTLRTLNWGVVPQLKTVHRSPLLYSVQTKDLGEGIIELTYVVHNFSTREDVVFDWLNAPWGGTRISSLPVHAVRAADGGFLDREWFQTHGGAVGVRKTGGWNISSVTAAPDSPALVLVFGRDRHLDAAVPPSPKHGQAFQRGETIYRHMLPQLPADWQTRPANSWRNYEVAVAIPQLNLAPGSTIWYRSFLVVNRRDRAMELADGLVEHVDYGQLTFDPATTRRLAVRIEQDRVADTGDPATMWLAAKPIPGSLPLFLLEDRRTGRELITTDPAALVPQEPLHLTIDPNSPKADYYLNAVGYSLGEGDCKWRRLLGYGLRQKPEESNVARLSDTVPAAMLPSPSEFHHDLWVYRQAAP